MIERVSQSGNPIAFFIEPLPVGIADKTQLHVLSAKAADRHYRVASVRRASAREVNSRYGSSTPCRIRSSVKYTDIGLIPL